jgi:hypothetical protein
MVPLRISAQDLVIVRLLAFEIGFHRGVVLLDGGLDQRFAPLFGLVLESSGMSLTSRTRAQVFALPDHSSSRSGRRHPSNSFSAPIGS